MSFGFGFGFPKRLTSGGGLSPRLYLDFIGTGSLPSTVTFSRGTNATLTDSNGRIAWAPHNLLTNSEDFEAAAWAKTGATVTANNAIAPDITTTADLLTENTATSQHLIEFNTSGVINTAYTLSCYVKQASGNRFAFVIMRNTAMNNGTACVLDFANKTFFTRGSSTSQSAQAVEQSNGWWRITITAVANATGALSCLIGLSDTNNPNVLNPSYTGDGTSGIFIWGAQLNVANAPVNLLTWSEQFDNAVWNPTGVGTGLAPVVTPNAAIAPNGTLTADSIVFDRGAGNTSGDQSYLIQSPSGIVNATYVQSIYLKAATSGDVGKQLAIRAVGVGTYVVITLTADWVQYSRTLTGSTSAWELANRGTFTTGNSVSALVWGAQLNTGSTPLPYVATTSSIYLPPAYNSTTPKNLLGFTQEPENAAWTKSNSYVQQNLLTWSQDFDNAAWTKSGGFITSTSVVAPDGSSTADTYTADGVLAGHYVRQTVTLLANTTYTFSLYAKPAGNDWGYLAVGGTGAGGYSTFNYSTGAVGSLQSGLVSRSITPVGNGWYRAIITLTTGGAVGSNYVEYSTSPTDQIGAIATSGGISTWGAQLVQGSTAGDYTQTTSAAAPTRYLNWDGTLTGRKLVEDTATNRHGVNNATGLNPILGVPYTYSVYAKKAERSWLIIDAFTNANAYTWFNLDTGTVGTNTAGNTATITSVGGGWYRCSVTRTSTSSVATQLYLGAWVANADNVTSYTGDGTSGIYVSDFQLSNSASVDPYVYNPQAAAASAAFYGPRFDYNPTGTEVLGPQLAPATTINGVAIGGPSFTTYASASVVAGRRYRVSFTISGYSGTNTLGVTNVGVTAGTSSLDTSLSANGTRNFAFVAASTGTVDFFTRDTNTANFSNISVQEVTGYTATANGLLIEEQRTNLLTYSEQFDNAAWTKSTSSVTANATVAPDGATTADKFIKNNGVDGQIYGTNTASVVSGTTYTISLFAKEAEWNFIKVAGGGAAFGNNGVTVNLSTGQIVATDVGVTGTATSVGNGWWRITATRAASASGIGDLVVFSGTSSSVNTVGNGTAGIFIWGAQLEAGSFATSYIPTVASQVTRNADSASMLGDNFYAWYNPNEGTFTSIANTARTSGYGGIISAGSGAPNRIDLGLIGPSGYQSVSVNSVEVAGYDNFNAINVNKYASGAFATSAIAYALNNSNAAVNGVAGTTDTACAVPPVTELRIGYDFSTRILNGTIRRISYYNTRLPDSTLQALTT